MPNYTPEEQAFIDEMSVYSGTGDVVSVDKSVKEAEKQLKEYQSKIKESAQFSPEQASYIQQYDLTVYQLLRLKALRTIYANNYQQPPGQIIGSVKKEVQLAQKFKGDPTQFIDTANNFYSQIDTAGSGLNYVQPKLAKSAAKLATSQHKTSAPVQFSGAQEPAKTDTQTSVVSGLTPGMKAAGVATPDAAKIGKPIMPTTVKPTTGNKTAVQNPSARNKIGAGGTVVPGANGASPPAGGGGDVTQPVATGKINEEALKKQFPGYEWVFDLGPQYKDTKDLYIQMLLGPEKGGITNERFQQLLPYSSFFKDQKVISTTRKINSTFGNLGLSGQSLAKVVNDAINFQYDDTELSQAFYSEVFKKDPTTGTYVNPSAASTALNGTQASGMRAYAKSMFMLGGKPDSMNGDIESILTGQMSQEDWMRSLRTTAKAVYSNWADVLNDPSMTMERLTKPWQDVAAQVLEMDPSQIDMSKPEFAAAYNGTDANGKAKSMSLGEWTVKLRTDPRYNWKNTQGAKQEARDLAYNLSVAFGKII